jgi:integrase
VRLTLRGIARTHGTAQRRAKPLTVAELLHLTSAAATTRDKRDHALLLIGFAGAFRRSELVAIDVENLAFVDEGVVVTIRRSKTDQEGQGRNVAIPVGRGPSCPVRALSAWLAASGIEKGPVFRRVARDGTVGAERLSSQTVALVLKEQIARTGGDPAGVSGHSLRAGFVTSAAKAGASSWKIRQQTGHKSDAMLARYIRDAELFSDNPASRLLGIQRRQWRSLLPELGQAMRRPNIAWPTHSSGDGASNETKVRHCIGCSRLRRKVMRRQKTMSAPPI